MHHLQEAHIKWVKNKERRALQKQKFKLNSYFALAFCILMLPERSEPQLSVRTENADGKSLEEIIVAH